MAKSQDETRAAVALLVEGFRQIPVETLTDYTEQEMRLNFILPLFRILGWNIESRLEVSAEEQVSRGRVDFGFYWRGVPAFYLETKRYSEDLGRSDWGRQAINYAWLKGVTWAVLCNFAGLKVFNAEVAEKIPARAVFLDLSWENYATTDFEDLWLLSKESVENRDLDALAERYGKKTKKETVTRLLFAQMTVWRRDIFKEVRAWGETDKLAGLDEAVQRLLDRLVFIRTMEDRLVEPPRLQALLRQYQDSPKKNKNLFDEIIKLFRELDGVYNARLFADHALDHLNLHNEVLLEGIINQLYDAPGGYDRYDFSAINADILGAVYEQYLSFKVIDPEGEDAIELSNGNGKRKAQGIFYTPQFIVRYIIQQTLGKHLEAGADPYTIKVLDPACGSGSFLLEAFDYLDRWLAEYGSEEDKANPYARRMRILQNNLYGVDLDPQAIEVAQLSLLLRASQGREKLPMLYHLREGNSLIDDEAVAGDLAFKWEEQFRQIMAQGGFDVVVGNPPYGAKIAPDAMSYIKDTYKRAAGTYDTYEMFLIRASQLLKDGGNLGMIIPSSWLTGESYTLSRQTFLETLSPYIAYALPFDVFRDAYIDTAIVTFSKGQLTDDCLVYYFPKKDKLETIPEKIGAHVPLETLKNDQQHRFSIMLSREITPLRAKLERAPENFGQRFRITRGVQPYSRAKHSEEDIENRFLHASSQLNKKYLPELQGTELARYYIAPKRSVYLEYSERLASSRSRNTFEGERLVLPRLLTRQFRLQASFAEKTMITTDNVINLIPKQGADLYTALAVLNSRAISWYYIGLSLIAQKDDFPQVHLSALKAIPLPQATETERDELKAHVGKMLDLQQKQAVALAKRSDKRHLLAQQIEDLDAQIDRLVYQLYGLTDEEIQLIEQGLPLG